MNNINLIYRNFTVTRTRTGMNECSQTPQACVSTNFTTTANLNLKNKTSKADKYLSNLFGKRGIRTLDDVLHHIDVPGLHLQPLGHLSTDLDCHTQLYAFPLCGFSRWWSFRHFLTVFSVRHLFSRLLRRYFSHFCYWNLLPSLQRQHFPSVGLSYFLFCLLRMMSPLTILIP